MHVTLLPEDKLRAALQPYRADPDTFEAGVRARLEASSSRQDDPFVNLSPALQSAAALLPLEVITGGQMTGTAFKLAPATGLSKLLGYLAFPAISLFVLLGATAFSIVRIRSIRDGNRSAPVDEQVLQASTKQWWHDHKWGALLIYAATLAMALIGATWLLFLFYIVSFGLLLYVLTSFGRIGLGNRWVIGSSCALGLGLLGQVAGFPGIGDQDIHFVDQALIAPLFFWGVFVLLLVMVRSIMDSSPRAGWRINRTLRMGVFTLFTVIVVSLTAWFMNPIFWPATPARIKAYVESFDKAPFSSSSWHQWEIVARWAVDSKLDPDLSGPRRLLAEQMAGEQNPFILGSAFRVGLVQADQLSQLKGYGKRRQFLLDDPTHIKETQQITSLEQEDWVIRAAVLRGDLTADERDFLAKRLHVTLEAALTGPYVVLKTLLLATQLLEVIERPVDPDEYRKKIHDLLQRFHSKEGGGFQAAGGFRYLLNNVQVGSLDATSNAVELMEIYGIPDDLDLNWVRSYLKPLFSRGSPRKWMAAVTLDRLNHLPGVTHPTWPETMYYERSLIAAVVLIGLCIYATRSSPIPKVVGAADESSPPESLHVASPV